MVVARISQVNGSALSYLERGASGAGAAKVKVARALADIETVLEQRRPINLDPSAIERGVAELRRTKGRAAAALSVKIVDASA
jgi:hypothetical protein